MITRVPLFRINFPANFNMLVFAFVGIANFEIVPSNRINPEIFNFENDTPLRPNFAQSEFSSRQTILNLGCVFYFMVIYSIGLVFLVLLKVLTSRLDKKKSKFRKFYGWYFNFMLLNTPLRFFLENYLVIVLSCLINLQSMDHKKTPSYILNDLTCYLTFIICTALPIFVTILFCVYYDKIKEGTMSKRVDTLYDGLALSKTTRITAGLYPIIFMVKRYLFCLVVIFMDDFVLM